ncbi:hypothetical protein [Arcanobacterium buesumense]|uniref:Uncharacterized protein n=1 Tax=Arcanobacterium buesumense TaxID=2722751 RepID=A0A6H2ELA5_9ACTO|nr:hypothetical protein [Arcanobacterium buesumense]QJC21821.1 hypothetical protein HC352_04425 [Arcanobacterium buesumense]
MGKLKNLIRIAAFAGPTIVKVVTTYAPQIRQLIKENPEYFTTLKQRLGTLASSNGRAVNHLSERVKVLREQAAYLYASANNAHTAQQAAQWRDELENIAKALPVLGHLDRVEKKKTRKNIDRHVDELAAKIVQATLEDDIEDAEIITDQEDEQ